MTSAMTLKEATQGQVGLPRPLAEYDGKLLPVPWNMDSSWGTLQSARADKGLDWSLCQVCGEPVVTGFVFVTTRDEWGRFRSRLRCYGRRHLERGEILDRQPLHARCAKLSEVHCVWLKAALAAGSAVRVPYAGELGVRELG